MCVYISIDCIKRIYTCVYTNTQMHVYVEGKVTMHLVLVLAIGLWLSSHSMEWDSPHNCA